MTFVRWFFSFAIAPFMYESRTCRRSPPGLYIKTRCTRKHDTICAPCSANHYTQYWNYVQKCQYCNNIYQENHYVKSECNQFHNRMCECKDGYFWKYEFCMKQKEFGRITQGFGVIAPESISECEEALFNFVDRQSRQTKMLQLGKALTILTQDDVVQIKNGKQQTRPLRNVRTMKWDVSISAVVLVKALREIKLKKIAKKVINKFLKK